MFYFRQSCKGFGGTRQFKQRFLFFSSGTVLVIIGLLSTVSISLAQGTWIRKADLNVERVALATCALDGKIYAIGGSEIGQGGGSGGFVSKAVEEYDPTTDTWTTKANMPTARANLVARAVNGKIYAIGGTKETWSSTLSTVEEYDPVTDSWTTKSNMQRSEGDLSAEVVNGKIYVIGGFTNSGVEEYDPATDTWVVKAAMQTQRGYLATTVEDGKIYVLGGTPRANNFSLQTVEVYDPATDTWTTKADMPLKRQNFSANTVNGIIYTVGGSAYPGGRGNYHTQTYNPSTNTWAFDANMLSSRVSLHSSVLNGKIYAIGGSTKGWPFNAVAILEEFTPDLTGIEASSRENNKPEEFALHQNYPNPFNPTTEIRYVLPEAAYVEVVIYNIFGQVIKTMVSPNQAAGYYSMVWDGTNKSGEKMSSGIYYYKLTAGKHSLSKKMTLLK